MQVSGGDYADENLGIVYREEVCLISLGSQLLADHGEEPGRVSPRRQNSPGGLRTSERSWKPPILSADLSQSPWGQELIQ